MVVTFPDQDPVVLVTKPTVRKLARG